MYLGATLYLGAKLHFVAKIYLGKSVFRGNVYSEAKLYFVSSGCVTNVEWIGNGHCEDETNTFECGFDSGDCCKVPVETSFCAFCICYH